MNSLYLILIVLLLLYTYVYDVMTCQWKLDVTKDTQVSGSLACRNKTYLHLSNYMLMSQVEVSSTTTMRTTTLPSRNTTIFPNATTNVTSFLNLLQSQVKKYADSISRSMRNVCATYCLPLISSQKTDNTSDNEANINCEHVVTTYVIPDLLHLAAFILGIVYFRVKENEHMFALTEKVSCHHSLLQAVINR